MSIKNEQEVHSPPRIPITCLQQPINPPNFAGKTSEYPHQWLKDYDRAARYNGWDDSMSIANVIFFLEDTAKRWYENEEENLKSWQTDNLVQKAEAKLKSRAQKANESSESYIQDILGFCSQVNPAMMEGEKLGHLMKGVKEHIYQVLFPVEMASVEEF
ncbi:hypothetical protein LAZ67_8001255 [Cordylochernes scorpioides]|uniref:Retrotransposon gag domain-containing protein n=1 Tax=Cordylochernes scorpioides TaxID=51811 RepID=A0ABY6KQJ0_9ARAC|nr:hypothetical protein LAZ67_8001255 [Cordylochernes scorpioides]